MKEELLADVWTSLIEHIPEKQRKDAATDFVNILLDHGIKETVLDSLMGIDVYLDQALEYAIDGEDVDDEYDDDDNYNKEED